MDYVGETDHTHTHTHTHTQPVEQKIGGIYKHLTKTCRDKKFSFFNF